MSFILLLLLALQSVVVAAPRNASPWVSHLDGTFSQRMHCGLPRALDEDSLHFYDVLHFEPHLSLNFANQQLSGFTLVELITPEAQLERVDFRFTHSLTVDSVWATENHAATLQSSGNDSIQVFLSPALTAGDTIIIGIAYHGTPEIIDNWGGFRWANASLWRPAIAFSNGDGLATNPPPINYTWFPCYEDPNDKAAWESWFTVPSGKVVSSSGIRVDTLNHGDGTTTWHYRLDQPVSTYLFFVSASDYVIQTQRASDPVIENFVYPSRVTQAETHFSNVPVVLDSFVARFGPYPFDRMGYNMARIGDMEHATCVTHLDQLVSANHIYDPLLFHEMSHMWWGNWVTLGDWRDLWINEGFATYCEALGLEALGGRPAYDDYVVNSLYPDGRSATDSYSIYDPDYYWGQTVYQKGACVMHMLRELLGDTAFFQAWREFGLEHAFANAITADWQAKLEQHYGGSLDWFFQPWVYGTRYPRYQAHYIQTDPTFVLNQVQTTATLFRMPMDIGCIVASNDTFEFTVWTEAVQQQTITIPDTILNHAVLNLVLDPHNKILKSAQVFISDAADDAPAVAYDFKIESVYPNPFNPATTLTFALPVPSPVTLSVYNLLGREVDRTLLGSFVAGKHAVSYDGSTLSSGVYVFRLASNFGVQSAKAVLLK